MKPLLNIEEFLNRFDNFKGGEFRSIEVISPTVMKITFAGQDTARAFDWVSISLECHGVSDARLLEASKLPHIDMNDGVSIIKENNNLAFGIGQCYNIASLKSSTCFIECTNIKYEEGLF